MARSSTDTTPRTDRHHRDPRGQAMAEFAIDDEFVRPLDYGLVE